MGVIKHLPEPRLPYLDAEKVGASPEAYAWLSTPGAVLAGFGATTTLAAMGSKPRVKEHPSITLALAAKTALDVFNATRLTRDQWTKHRAFCIWCLMAAGVSFAILPFVIPETLDTLRNLRFNKLSQILEKAA